MYLNIQRQFMVVILNLVHIKRDFQVVISKFIQKIEFL